MMNLLFLFSKRNWKDFSTLIYLQTVLCKFSMLSVIVLHAEKFKVTKDQAVKCLNDNSLADLDNLSDPDVLAEEIAKNLESALSSFQKAIRQLKK
ncbi:MAG: hypothetical protein WKF91_14165 [Segetibacter sp.]